MNFTCQRPEALYAIFLLIPALIFGIYHYRQVVNNYKKITIKDSDFLPARRIKKYRITIMARSVFLSLFWIMLVLAYAGFSWGTYLEPVQKSGSAVSLVYDISYSMNADDAPGGMTRLNAAKKYSAMLLSRMENTAVSVVIAKGEGVVVVPLTEDRAVVESLLDSLSPALMSAGGSSIGKGIRSALKSFPSNSSQANTIWVFTDGDETDGMLDGALADCIKNGVSVYLIGFGTEREVKVLAGDGRTPVMTALRIEKMKSACNNAMKKNMVRHISDLQVAYVDATEPGSALQLLDSIKGGSVSSGSIGDENDSDSQNSVTYELKPMQRYSLFLGLGIIFLVLSFLVSELDPDAIANRIHRNSIISIIFLVMTLTSCRERVEGAKTILSSTWNWYQHKYNDAIAGYLQTACEAESDGDKMLEQYAVYGLAVTYLSQNENDAALERFGQLESSESNSVKYAANYNCGIIAYRKGNYDTAARYFREALKVDGSKVDAKINLELSLKNSEKEAKARENSISRVNESDSSNMMEEAVFERIREYDKKQWKNSEKTENISSATDY